MFLEKIREERVLQFSTEAATTKRSESKCLSAAALTAAGYGVRLFTAG